MGARTTKQTMAGGRRGSARRASRIVRGKNVSAGRAYEAKRKASTKAKRSAATQASRKAR